MRSITLPGAHRMRPPAQPLFLARKSYRRRRMIDALRLVPVVGALLFMVPVLGATGHAGASFRGAIYLFSSWALLILLTAVLSRRVTRGESIGTGDGAGGEELPENTGESRA